jgi:hypothetical protein
MTWISTHTAIFLLWVTLVSLPTQLKAQSHSGDQLLTGVVEGFYGTPWTPEQRVDLIQFMGEFGLKHYVYAPKDDPLHRNRWSEPYPDSNLQKFGQLLELGEQNGVTIWFAISPGLSIRYSNDEDFSKLTAKLDQVMNAGFRNVALFLDDVPERLQHEEDREVYSNIAYAHADLIQRLHAYLLERGVALWVCPTVYTDSFGDQQHLSALGPLVPDGVPLFWTGPDVASPDITKADVDRWTKRTGSTPLIWDNYPVNDFEVWRPFLGPYPPRDPDGVRSTLGFIANPGPSMYTSMVGLAALVDLVSAPDQYNPDSAHRDALIKLFGEDAYPLVRPIVDFYSAYGWEDHAFSGLYKPGTPLLVSRTDSLIAGMKTHLENLRNVSSKNARLTGFLSEVSGYFEASVARYDNMKADPNYWVFNDSLLFNDELDRYTAKSVRRPLSVNSRDWSQIPRKPMFRDGVAEDSDFNYYDVQYAATPDTLFTRIMFKAGTYVYIDQQTMFGGNLATLSVSARPSESMMHPADGDLFVVTTPGNPFIELSRFTLKLGGFASRGIADINLRQISSFFHQFAVVPAPEYRNLFDGVRVEGYNEKNEFYLMAAIPRNGRNEILLNWSLNLFTTVAGSDTENPRSATFNWMASRRSYLGNPQTWVRIQIPD